uniref:Putative chaperone n=1 Tax=viral metagenome TaxID=1070528 RepID=A0A6M3LVH3_9ZZZZ
MESRQAKLMEGLAESMLLKQWGDIRNQRSLLASDSFRERAKQALLYIQSHGGVLKVKPPCHSCKGTGKNNYGRPCLRCNGTGWYGVELEPLIQEEEICPKCGGNITLLKKEYPGFQTCAEAEAVNGQNQCK